MAILLVGTGGYSTIQAAVDAAADGDEIVIEAGTYVEQVTISGREGLNIHGDGGAVIIQAPADIAVNGVSEYGTDSNVRAVVAVNDSTDITIWGVTIDGAFAGDTTAGSNGDELAGLAYLRSSGDVFSITVENVGNSVGGGLFGLQHGVGILVDGTGLVDRPSFDLQDSTITDFQKTGVHVIGAELYYFDNRVTGIGATDLTAQNGLQVQLSTGTIIDATIENLGYTGADYYSSGIIAFRNDDLEINAINFAGAAGGAGSFAAIDLSGIALGETVTVANNNFGTAGNPIDYGVVAYGYQDVGIDDVLEGQVAISGNNFNGIEINGVYYDTQLFAAPSTLAREATGSSVADALFGSSGNDNLQGLEGDDLLNGRKGNDIINGGAGIDTVSYDDAASYVNVNLALTGLQSTHGAGKDTLSGIENVIGSAFGDTLNGDGNANRLDGGAGNDKLIGNGGNDDLIGGAGNDRLQGGIGADTMAGGLGNDSYYVDQAGDAVSEAVGEGTDWVYSAVSYELGADLENLALTGNAIDGTGNALKNIIVGSAGANVINGGAGADTLSGGAGADTFVFDILGTSATKDTVKDFVSGIDKIQLSTAAFAALSGYGLGALDPGELAYGTKAATPDEHLIYNAGNGALLYDADGLGGAAAITIAVLSGHPPLNAGDIILV